MHHASISSHFLTSGLVLAVSFAAWCPTRMFAAEPMEMKPMTEAKMMESCKQMLDEKKKMMEDVKLQDAQLSEQITAMNKTQDDRKVNVMAAVVTNLAEQRISMDVRRAKMEERMMTHMMQHMQMGKDSMAQCPMMKEMSGMKGMGDMKGMPDNTGEGKK